MEPMSTGLSVGTDVAWNTFPRHHPQDNGNIPLSHTCPPHYTSACENRRPHQIQALVCATPTSILIYTKVS